MLFQKWIQVRCIPQRVKWNELLETQTISHIMHSCCSRTDSEPSVSTGDCTAFLLVVSCVIEFGQLCPSLAQHVIVVSFCSQLLTSNYSWSVDTCISGYTVICTVQPPLPNAHCPRSRQTPWDEFHTDLFWACCMLTTCPDIWWCDVVIGSFHSDQWFLNTKFHHFLSLPLQLHLNVYYCVKQLLDTR